MIKRNLFRIGAALIGVAVVVAIFVRVPAIQDALVRRAIHQALSANRDSLLRTDALRVLLCGTGNPLADRSRADACTAVIVGGGIYLVDVGPNSWKNLALWHIPGAKLRAVMITHYHSDHIGDLGEANLQSWAQGRDHPLKVYGPPGVEQVVNGFAQAYSLDEGYRIAHHGAALMPPDNWQMQAVPIEMPVTALPGAEAQHFAVTVLDEDGLKVTAFTVDHAPVAPAYGYRFDYKGRSVVISGDTRPCANLVENSRDADVLVSEAQSAEMVKMIEAEARAQGNERAAKIMHDILRYHTTPAEAATEANEAGARMLVLSHIGPPTPNAIARMIFMRGVSAIRPHGVVLGYDGMLLTMPAGSTAIDISSIE